MLSSRAFNLNLNRFASNHLIFRNNLLKRSFCITNTNIPGPPEYEIPTLPPNLHISEAQENIFSPLEDQKRNFVYEIKDGKKLIPLLKLTKDKKLLDTGSKIELNDFIGNTPVRKDIIHRVVRWQLANRRNPTAKTLGVGQVRGSTRKPHPQKGQGKARQGSLHAPHMRGGGHAHPKGGKIFKLKLQKKVRRLGLRAVLNARFIENQLFVIDTFDLNEATGESEELNQDGKEEEEEEEDRNETAAFFKTKDINNMIKNMGWNKVVFVDQDNYNTFFQRATNNIPKSRFFRSTQCNVYDILCKETLVFSKKGFEEVVNRLDENQQKQRKLDNRANL